MIQVICNLKNIGKMAKIRSSLKLPDLSWRIRDGVKSIASVEGPTKHEVNITLYARNKLKKLKKIG